jgi:Uma2 family endonuclease
MSTHTKIWTEAELMALPKDGNKYELVNGELQMSPAGGHGHGDIIAWLSGRLVMHVRENKLGIVYDGQTGFWMKSGNLRSPDISVVGKDRLKEFPKQRGFLHIAPDLAVEVLSESDISTTISEKAAEYFDSGTQLLWVVNPVEKTVLVYHSATPDTLLKSGDSLDGENVVPGFSMPIDELFAEVTFE